MPEPLVIARSGDIDIALLPGMANRHGCITGATGTGKTITLQVLAEQFSRIGVPVFLADVKGDLTGITKAGQMSDKLGARLKKLGLPEPKWRACPATLWDVFGEQGHPVRATISDIGPLLLARLLNLNDTQEGVLAMVFKIADDNGLLLLNLQDLRAMLQFVGDNAAQFKTQYGNVSAASIGTIQRGMLQIEQQGGHSFFGEPMLNIADLMQTVDGQGVVNVLAADRLINNPRLYACFLLWLLSELFEQLPEVGDPEKPKLVFFFDEAHLLFNEAPPALLEKVEQVVRLIRSKGVGVYFVTQNPIDIPDKVLGQLGNRVQHALRAFTPRDQKAVKATAEVMRPNPKIDIEKVILELGVGEALVSLLDEKGAPGITQRAWMLAPGSQIGPITPEERWALIANSVVAGVYEKEIDRESALEMLSARTAAAAASAGSPASFGPSGSAGAGTASSSGWASGGLGGLIFGTTGPRGGKHDGLIDLMAKSAARSAGSSISRSVLRGVLGSLTGGRR
ncbi:MAG: helicase HerA-like domain-containing protein [Gemmatimonadales bacterium]